MVHKDRPPECKEGTALWWCASSCLRGGWVGLGPRVDGALASASVAFGGKRTSNGRQDPLAQSRMTQLRHRHPPLTVLV
jgi:hypothetical protein